MTSAVASLTLTRYAPPAFPRGFLKMGSDHLALRGARGLTFYRLLGTSRGSDLTLSADPLRWARFCVWEDPQALQDFEEGTWRARERRAALESWTVALRPVRWKGEWGGRRPFGPDGHTDAPDGPLGILTRGTIRPRLARTFWRSVPASQAALHGNPALIASVGVGEVPLLYQGTFSVWRDLTGVRDFAYGAGGHLQAVRRTRELDWYSEEMFARFALLREWGTWDGRELLTGSSAGGRT